MSPPTLVTTHPLNWKRAEALGRDADRIDRDAQEAIRHVWFEIVLLLVGEESEKRVGLVLKELLRRFEKEGIGVPYRFAYLVKIAELARKSPIYDDAAVKDALSAPKPDKPDKPEAPEPYAALLGDFDPKRSIPELCKRLDFMQHFLSSASLDHLEDLRSVVRELLAKVDVHIAGFRDG